MKGKNKYGQYFTEAVVADFMVTLISHSTESRVLEPSCGEGVFLKKLAEHGYLNRAAFEIDTELAHDFDFIQYRSFISSPISDKFDVVIGNPPYIRWKNLENELKEELSHNHLWNRYFNSLCDYLFIFILKSIEQLHEGGELIFICSDYWMNTTNSQSLRNYMCANGYFERIYHFKEAPLFEKVNASFVIFKYIKSISPSTQPIQLFSYNKKGKPKKEELQSGTCFNNQEIPQFLQNQRWILASQKVQDELTEFENACIKQQGLFDIILNRIGDVCEIANGMVSGLDTAFKVTKEESQFFNDKEKQCLINVLKAKNLEQFTFTSSEQYIYITSSIPVNEFEENYPHFVEHFLPYIEKLDKRYNYGRTIPYWEFTFPRSKNLFERDEAKIFIPCKERISHKKYFRFCYSPNGYYPLQDVTGIVRKPQCKETIEYLLAYLNCDRVFNWLRFNGIVKGEIVEFSEAPISSIPYLRVDWANTFEVILHEKITKEVREYLKDKNKEHITQINNHFNTLFYEKSRLQGCC